MSFYATGGGTIAVRPSRMRQLRAALGLADVSALNAWLEEAAGISIAEHVNEASESLPPGVGGHVSEVDAPRLYDLELYDGPARTFQQLEAALAIFVGWAEPGGHLIVAGDDETGTFRLVLRSSDTGPQWVREQADTVFGAVACIRQMMSAAQAASAALSQSDEHPSPDPRDAQATVRKHLATLLTVARAFLADNHLVLVPDTDR